jgi:hypothetical protein
LLSLIDAELKRLEPFVEANEQREKEGIKTIAAIHRAADLALTEAVRDRYSRRDWTRIVWRWLGLRFRETGFARRPSRKTIGKALASWEPPHGSSIIALYPKDND